MSHTPTLHWVNHASFIFAHNNIRLITDPWLFGSAFNNGWDLLCETLFTVDDFADITHIWFSHEHPDHFAPAVLKQIPVELRCQITILFQATKDKKVITYCELLYFQVQELPNHQWHELAPDVSVLCGKVPYFDSWLLIEAQHSEGRKTRILNANDCVVDGDGVAKEIAKHTGTVDLLLTQFSYANWIGNPDEVELRRASAREKLGRVKLQVDTFQPTYTIPFASFVYFSHEENFYLNDAMNSVRDAHAFIANETTSEPIILYPGEQWVVGGQPHDNQHSLARYDQAYELESKPLRTVTSVPFDELKTLSAEYITRITKQNSRLVMKLMALPPLRYFQPLKLYLTDLKLVAIFDINQGLLTSNEPPSNAEVSLASESLAYVFKFDWGYDTLDVSGRFRATQQNYKKMIKTFFLGPLNNTGRYLQPKTLFEPSFVKRALGKLRSLG